MWRFNIILISSFLIVLLPFLGLPQFIDDIFYLVFGILIFISAFLLRHVIYSSNKKEVDKVRQNDVNIQEKKEIESTE